MIISDCHMHSSFSSDSTAPMEDMILSAISKGLKIICFTEHMDYDYPIQGNEDPFIVDMDAYQKCLYELKDKYSKQIEVLFGIELGMMPYLGPKYDALVSQYDFDFVLSSSHLVNGQDPYYRTYFEGRNEGDAYREYFQTIIDNVSAFDKFNAYAHLDYVVRYGPTQNRQFSYIKYMDILEPVLKKLIENGKALEINTGGYTYGLNEPHPQMDLLKAFKGLGGEHITIGSDAHKPENIGAEFSKVLTILEHFGFKYYSVYKKGKPEMIKI